MSNRKVFADSITPIPVESGLTPQGLLVNAADVGHKEEEMTLLFSLAISPAKQQELEDRVSNGEVISAAEMNQKYVPEAGDVQALTAWLKAQGYHIEQQSPGGTGVYARAKVSQIESSLETKMVRVTKDGLTYNAAQTAPSLPADVGKSVHAIVGLQPFRQAHKHSRMRAPLNGNRAVAEAGAAAGPTTNIQNAPPYLVSEVLKAYDADTLKLTGKGQTIAILIDTFPADSDLQAFWTRNNLNINLSQIQKINVKGGALPPQEGEETLDVEWSSGVAPNATIRIYASGSLQFVDLDRALDRILTDVPNIPGLRQVSISLGLGETFFGTPNGEVATQHQKFVRLAAAGVNVFVSSGDAGSNPDSTGHSSTGPVQAEYESSDPFVVGVGGTSLKLSPTGAVAKESAWAGSGGGKSIFFPRPVWQKGPGVPIGTARLVPDVSMAADPNEGALVVLHGKVSQIGGTSWSAPVWAGFCALLNEARANAHQPSLPFLNPLLYALSANTGSFRDISAGSNGAFHAGPGYDMVTGLGVPNLVNLAKALTSVPAKKSAAGQ